MYNQHKCPRACFSVTLKGDVSPPRGRRSTPALQGLRDTNALPVAAKPEEETRTRSKLRDALDLNGAAHTLMRFPRTKRSGSAGCITRDRLLFTLTPQPSARHPGVCSSASPPVELQRAPFTVQRHYSVQVPL